MAEAAHGGRVYEAAERWGISPDEVIDFSANINPLGPPMAVLSAIQKELAPVRLRSYPDSRAFISTISEKHRISPDQIVVGAGTAALMFAALRALAPKTALVLEPGFDEYFRACSAIKTEVLRHRLSESRGFAPDFDALARIVQARQCDLLILNSPHNPTGRLYPREDLIALLGIANENGVSVLVDEAFIDYAPQASLLSAGTSDPRCIVLRSLTKFYAIPGLRIGYAVCAADLAARIRRQIDAWPVSSIALEAARAALFEEDFEIESRRVNTEAREEFADALRKIGLLIFPSDANYLLIKLTQGCGTELARWLESSRILIRRCDSFSGLGDAYLRLAVKARQDNLRLVSLIESWLQRSDEC